MKKTILTVFASLLLVIGGLMLLLTTVYGWGTWNKVEGGVGWLDFQMSNKMQIPFLTKGLALLLGAALLWVSRRQLIRNDAGAKWMTIALFGIGLVFAVVGTAMWSLQQADFFYRNESSLQTIRTILYALMSILLIIGSLGLLGRNRKAYWIVTGLVIAGVCINLANLIVVIAYPVIVSLTEPNHEWLTRWGIEALFHLAVCTVGLLLLIWIRSEMSTPDDSLGERTTAAQLLS
jgi:hypothetical protein